MILFLYCILGLPVSVVSDGGLDYSQTAHLTSFFMIGGRDLCPVASPAFMVAVLFINPDGLVIHENCKVLRQQLFPL